MNKYSKSIVLAVLAVLLTGAWVRQAEPRSHQSTITAEDSSAPHKSSTSIRASTSRCGFNLGVPPVPHSPLLPVAEQIQAQILALRSKAHWQYRPSAETFQIEAALGELKSLGLQPDDLAPGVMEDPLDFLSPSRKAEIQGVVVDQIVQLRTIEWDNLGEAWDGPTVDRYNELQKDHIARFRELLTTDEFQEYIARHSSAGDQLRNQRLDLTEEQFKAVAQAQFEFAHAEVSDSDPDRLAALLRGRNEQISTVLGADGFARFERAQLPAYEAHVDTALNLGLKADWGDWLFQVEDAVRRYEVSVWDRDDLPEIDKARTKAEAIAAARAHIRSALGDVSYEAWWNSPAALPFHDEGDAIAGEASSPRP